jgi:hypothetical protein
MPRVHLATVLHHHGATAGGGTGGCRAGRDHRQKFPDLAHDVACKCARDGCRRGDIRGGWTLDLKRAVRLPNTLADAIIAVFPSDGRIFLKRLGQ